MLICLNLFANLCDFFKLPINWQIKGMPNQHIKLR